MSEDQTGPGVIERSRDSRGEWFERVLHRIGMRPNRAAAEIGEGFCPACGAGLAEAENGWLACTGRCAPTEQQWMLVPAEAVQPLAAGFAFRDAMHQLAHDPGESAEDAARTRAGLLDMAR